MADFMFFQWINWQTLTYACVALHFLLQVGLAFRVIMRRCSVGESLAWVLLIFVFPIFGPLIYLTLGELRLGRRRRQRVEELVPPIQDWIRELAERFQIDWTVQGQEHHESLARLAGSSLGFPALPGNRIDLEGDWQAVFRRLVDDIDAAKTTCHLEFYIWQPEGIVLEVEAALIRASQRGVVCRVLVDAMGSRSFLRSRSAAKMREAGIEVLAALPGGLVRMLFVRFDLRLHRKVVAIDGRIAYTGSLNLVDPRCFKQDAAVGQWVDAMVRIEGPAVEALGITFLGDWYVESSDDLKTLREQNGVTHQPERGDCPIQALPSGPAFRTEAIEQILIMAIYLARRELVLTTPYFVPSESLRMALESAARRGVEVTLIVPAKVDSLMVRYASQAFQGDLLKAGVRIATFEGGLLHTKSMTVDGQLSLFGSLNLDPRSFRLNFEISLIIYDRDFTQQLRALQQSYLDQSQWLDRDSWNARSMGVRIAENVARLAGPLL